jgi:hypothetical protein
LEITGDQNNPEIISYEEYYPFGSTSYQAMRNQTETSKRYRYTGKEPDEESGLYYHGQDIMRRGLHDGLQAIRKELMMD